MRTEIRNRQERDNLYTSIQASNRGRQVVDFDGPEGYFPSSSGAHDDMADNTEDVEVETTVVKTPLATSRANSPYTQHPTVDFDGLSWPSR